MAQVELLVVPDKLVHASGSFLSLLEKTYPFLSTDKCIQWNYWVALVSPVFLSRMWAC